MDNRQALVDSTLYTAVALKLCGLAALGYTLVAALGLTWIPGLPGWPALLIIALLALGSSFALYRVSLHLHAQYGDSFKAMFDIHRNKLHDFVDNVMTEIAAHTDNAALADLPYRDKYAMVVMYLDYHRVPAAEGGFRAVGK